MQGLLCWPTGDAGDKLHVYSGLSFAGAVGAMSYHPSQHMLAFAAFGSCQPLLIFNHVNEGVISKPKVATSALIRGGGVPLGVSEKRESKGTRDAPPINSAAREKWSSLSLGVLGGLDTPPLKESRRLSDLVKTLDRVTARTKS